MKLLLPLDIVHPVEPTIGELVRLVPLENAEVLLLYVKEELPAYEKVVETQANFEEDWAVQLEKRARLTLDEVSTLLKQHCRQVHTEIVMGPAALMIETVARDESFSVTAVTPGSHSAVEMFLLGSVSSKVVKHCPGSVLILRPAKSDDKRIKHVVMGIDGSPQSRNAIEQAGKILKINGDEVQITLMHVVSVADVFKLISPVEYISLVENNLLMEGETFLADGKRILSEMGFKRVECVLKEGDPATELINLSRSLPADLIVIGAQGRSAVQHFLLGSVSHRVAMHSPCSTLVVKPLAR